MLASMTLSTIRDQSGDNNAILARVTDITHAQTGRAVGRNPERDPRAINSALTADEIMQQVLVESAAALDCESASIMLREGVEWRVKYVYGMPAEVIGRAFAAAELPYAEHTVATGDVTAVADLSAGESVTRKKRRNIGALAARRALNRASRDGWRGVFQPPFAAGHVPTIPH